MRFLRFGPKGQEKPGVMLEDGRIYDLSDRITDISGDVLGKLDTISTANLPVVEGSPRIGPCVGHVGKFICIGLNYSDHAKEAGMDAPEEPIVFMKATSAIAGPNDALPLPRGSEKTDWEVELGVVIGQRAKHVSVEEALEHVAGYCIAHDVSERAFQIERGGQWTKGKSCDGFGPIGPWIVTPDEVGDPQKLRLQLSVNGTLMQDGTTANMIFSVAEIIAHLSDFMTLEPGDVIATGTPKGVGMGLSPPSFLKAGDRVDLSIEGLGAQRQTVIADA
ncbi:MAG: fumarylacetoacetate hydrolase family protein [Halocynthiibacter sp.]